MSKCISIEGEYSEHELAEQPRFACVRCFAFDEEAALAALDEAERESERLRLILGHVPMPEVEAATAALVPVTEEGDKE